MEKMMQEQAEFMHDQKRVNQQVADQIRDLGMKVDLLATQGKLLKTQVARPSLSWKIILLILVSVLCWVNVFLQVR
jgi:uncharacterized membrane protein